jgi:hypothetical protein
MTRDEAAVELDEMLAQFVGMPFARDPHPSLRPLPPGTSSPARILSAVETRLSDMACRGLPIDVQCELRAAAARMVQRIDADVYRPPLR